MSEFSYKNFYDPSEEFQEEPRAFCYDLAKELLEKAKKENPKGSLEWYTSNSTVKGVLLLLFTWNFAARKTKKLTHEKIRKMLSNNARKLHELEGISIEGDIDEESWGKIKEVFDDFKEVVGQTGASKALSLLNPDLFVMWDTAIRKELGGNIIKGIGNGENGKKYVKFLKGIQKIIKENNLSKKAEEDWCLAKKIDEYHYVEIVMKKNN